MDSLFLLITGNPATMFALPVIVIVVIIVVVVLSGKKKQNTTAVTPDQAAASASWKPASPDSIVAAVSLDPAQKPVSAEAASSGLSTEVVDPLPTTIEEGKSVSVV